MVISDRDIKTIGQFIINELASELIKQDHKATGKLISSLDYTANDALLGKELIITMNDYGENVNRGRKKGVGKPTRENLRKHGVPLPALIKWIKDKGLASGDKKVLGMAAAIQRKIWAEGSPTANSRKRGKRTEFVDDTIKRIQSEVERRITEATFRQVDIIVDNFVARI